MAMWRSFKIYFMKYSIVLLLFVFANCKSQKDQYVLSEKDGYTLPAHHLSKSEETSLLNSIRESKSYADFQRLIVNNKEYPPRQFPAILDTLDNSYTFDLKVDSVSSDKILVITKRR
jgi:hypothetical protein